MAALKPERFAFPAAYIYTPLLKLLYPLVYIINTLANRMISLIGINAEEGNKDTINTEEIRAVVNEARHLLPQQHSDMLLRILDLENTRVEDIMIPRNDITGIDLDEDWIEIERQISNSQRTRVPVFNESIDNVVGMLHLRKVLNLLTRDELNLETLHTQIREAYFIPEGTALTQQLINFQKNRRRSGLVVDEYGSIMGLVTLEDILEEIVGQFTTDSPTRSTSIYKQDDGSYLIDGGTHIREINRTLGIRLPTDGPRTLNGLILEHLEMIPETGTSLMIDEVPIEITRVSNNAVHMARLTPLRDEDTLISATPLTPTSGDTSKDSKA
jgi:Mg2+/Co2+ transporter CorB